MARLSKAKTIELLQSPSFFESLKYQFGSYNKASKATGINARRISELADQRRTWHRGEISDKMLDKFQTGLNKLKSRQIETGKRFIWARDSMTPAQLRYAGLYSKKSETGRKYFSKAVNEYYEGSTKRVLMPAISETGTYMPHKKKSPITKPTRSGRGKNAVRRSRRRSNRR